MEINKESPFKNSFSRGRVFLAFFAFRVNLLNIYLDKNGL